MSHTVNTVPTFLHPGGPRVAPGVPEGGEWMIRELAYQAYCLLAARMVLTAETANRGAAGHEFKRATRGEFAPKKTKTDPRRERSATAWGHK